MNKPYRFTLAVVVSALACGIPWPQLGADSPPGEQPISIERIRADVKYLSSDQLQGRGIGSRGEEVTVDFIAGQFAKAGLKPAGERGSFFQAVPLVVVTTGPAATLAVSKGDQTIPFKLEEEFAGTSKTQ